VAMRAVFTDKATGQHVATIEQGTMPFNAFRELIADSAKQYPPERFNMLYDNEKKPC
jgi:hypothetical protein